MAVSKRLRYEVLRRDNHQCRYCHSTDNPLTVDHVIPTTLGGTDDPANLVAACRDCNAGKSASNPDAPLVADVEQDALRWSNAMLTAADALAWDRDQRDRMRAWFEKLWTRWTYPGPNGERLTIDLPADWPLSVDRFVQAGITEHDIQDAVDTTMRTRGVNEPFSYFAGICWRRVAQYQQMARQILASEDNG